MIVTNIIKINNLEIEVLYKNVKTLRITIFRNNAKIRVTSPLLYSQDDIKKFLLLKIDWITKTHTKMYALKQNYISRKYRSGEKHFFLGNEYTLEIKKADYNGIVLDNNIIYIYLKNKNTIENRKKILYQWYREELSHRIPNIIHKWEKCLNVKCLDWRIKIMRTRWGTCNINSKRIWINLELVKMDNECLDYIILHELTHLLEKYHNDNFKNILTYNMPSWKFIEKKMISLLNIFNLSI